MALAARSFGHGSPEQVLEHLSRVDILRALPAEEVQALVPYVEQIEVPQGTRVITQGESGDALYIVEDGIARVTLDDAIDLGAKGPGAIFGEMALLTNDRRTATVTAETDLVLWRVTRDDLERVSASSPKLRASLQDLALRHRQGQEIARGSLRDRRSWRARALRAIAARRRGVTAWQVVMVAGFLIVAALHVSDSVRLVNREESELLLAGLELLAGLAILQGACEAFVLAVERTGARLRWNGFISGTVGEAVSTLPEFVVIAFLVSVEPLAAFVTAVVTIFNNALGFSVYSFFLPKDQKGLFVMPRALAKAGGEVLIVGSGVAMIVGFVMLALSGRAGDKALASADVLLIGIVMIVIYAYYMYTLVRYYAEGQEDVGGKVPPDPAELGHATSWRSIGMMFTLGIAGSYFGGEAIGGFADTALNKLGLPTIPTAAFLAFFAGISEYIIVWKAHRRGELGIALSTVFGGITQVMFLLLPFAMIVIGVLGLVTGNPLYMIPINLDTTLLMLLLFPLFYVLLEFLKDDHTLNNLDAAAMTGIYTLMLYFLFTAKS